MLSIQTISFLVTTYLIASIPFGLLLGKIICKKDIRKHGSKNIGATNATRIMGKKWGFVTLVLDGLKGAIMILVAKKLFAGSEYHGLIQAITGLVAIVGHIYPIYLKFSGGKGVATSIAVILAINPYMGIAIILMWGFIFLTVRISAVASLLSMLLACLFAIQDGSTPTEQAFLYVAILFLIFIRHKDNLIRLKDRNENRI